MTHTNNIWCSTQSLVAIALAMLLPDGLVADAKPNILFILADDLGYGDVGCYGAKTIKTPNIDKLCEHGMKFTSFYVHNTCSATRLAFMTGSHAHRAGSAEVIYWWDRIGIHSDEITTPELLREAGYKTGIVGKWHLGHWEVFNPVHHGFDYFYGFQGVDKSKMAIYRNTEMIERINKPKTHGKFTPQLLQAGVDFIKESKDQPFFLFYSSPLPHVPWIPGEDFKVTSDHGKYGDVVQEIDHQVGVLLMTIAELGLTDNTLVVFASDNGPQLTINGYGSPGPLRDGKWSNFEGGIRVPCIMRWPTDIPAGSVNHEITGIIDLLPTFSEIAGVQPPTDRVLDGKSILPYMRGEGVKSPIHDTFVVPNRSIRHDDWKLFVSKQNPGGPVKQWGNRRSAPKGALFNLTEDVGETADVSAQHPEIAAELQKMMKEWMKELRASKREIGTTPDYTDEKRKAAWEAVRSGKQPE